MRWLENQKGDLWRIEPYSIWYQFYDNPMEKMDDLSKKHGWYFYIKLLFHNLQIDSWSLEHVWTLVKLWLVVDWWAWARLGVCIALMLISLRQRNTMSSYRPSTNWMRLSTIKVLLNRTNIGKNRRNNWKETSGSNGNHNILFHFPNALRITWHHHVATCLCERGRRSLPAQLRRSHRLGIWMLGWVQ